MNTMPVSAAQVASGLTKAASVLSDAGASIEQASAMVTGGGAVTQDFEAMGNSLKIATLRIRGMKGELEELGEEVDDNVVSASKMQTKILNATHGAVNIFEEDGETFRNIYDIFADIAEIMPTLNDKERAALLEDIAGKNRSNAVLAVLKNWSQVEEALTQASEAEGTAAAENEKYMASMQGKLDTLSATWQAFSNDFFSSDFLKRCIEGLTSLLNLLDSLVSNLGTLGTLGLATGITALIKNLG